MGFKGGERRGRGDEDRAEGSEDMLAERRQGKFKALGLIRLLVFVGAVGGISWLTFASSTNRSSRASICECSDALTRSAGVYRPRSWVSPSPNRSLFITAHHIGTVFDKASAMVFPLLVESTMMHLTFLSPVHLSHHHIVHCIRTLHASQRHQAPAGSAFSY